MSHNSYAETITVTASRIKGEKEYDSVDLSGTYNTDEIIEKRGTKTQSRNAKKAKQPETEKKKENDNSLKAIPGKIMDFISGFTKKLGGSVGWYEETVHPDGTTVTKKAFCMEINRGKEPCFKIESQKMFNNDILIRVSKVYPAKYKGKQVLVDFEEEAHYLIINPKTGPILEAKTGLDFGAACSGTTGHGEFAYTSGHRAIGPGTIEYQCRYGTLVELDRYCDDRSRYEVRGGRCQPKNCRGEGLNHTERKLVRKGQCINRRRQNQYMVCQYGATRTEYREVGRCQNERVPPVSEL